MILSVQVQIIHLYIEARQGVRLAQELASILCTCTEARAQCDIIALVREARATIRNTDRLIEEIESIIEVREWMAAQGVVVPRNLAQLSIAFAPVKFWQWQLSRVQRLNWERENILASAPAA